MNEDIVITIKKTAIFDLLNSKKAETRVMLNKRLFINGEDVTTEGEHLSCILEVEE